MNTDLVIFTILMSAFLLMLWRMYLVSQKQQKHDKLMYCQNCDTAYLEQPITKEGLCEMCGNPTHPYVIPIR